LEQQKVVITGGPGTGKSTVIEKLTQLQFTCMPEISRTITKEAQASGIEQLFLKDPLLFSKLLLDGRIDQYQKAQNQSEQLVFFDRGIPDVFGYLDYLNMDYPDVFIDQSIRHRYTKIFMMPPWKDIYKTDNERYETYEQSLIIYEHLILAYKKIAYPIVNVPEGDIDSRVEFILNSLKF
jgi:predicted ATPase